MRAHFLQLFAFTFWFRESLYSGLKNHLGQLSHFTVEDRLTKKWVVHPRSRKAQVSEPAAGLGLLDPLTGALSLQDRHTSAREAHLRISAGSLLGSSIDWTAEIRQILKHLSFFSLCVSSNVCCIKVTDAQIKENAGRNIFRQVLDL